MLDAVREAAREMDDLDENEIMDFLQARAKDPGAVNIQQFLELVKEQKFSDLVDILDTSMRGAHLRPTGRRRVKITAPRGYVKRVMAGLAEDDVAEIIHRLEARGHDPENVDNFLVESRFKDENRKKTIREKKSKIEASDQWQAEAVEFTEPDESIFEEEQTLPDTALQMAKEIASNIQPPIVNITLPEQKVVPMRREVIRDEKTGLAVAYREVPEDAS
jgi:hypothetical protein